MLYKRHILLFLFVLFSLTLSAAEFWTPTSLERMSSTSVVSITQDGFGAIWMNTGRGLFRYNGNDAESRYDIFPTGHIYYDGEQSVYAISQDNLIRFDTASSLVEQIPLPHATNRNSLAFYANNGHLIIAADNTLYYYDGDSFSHIHEFPEGYSINTLFISDDGILYVGIRKLAIAMLSLNGDVINELPCDSEAMAFFVDKNGVLWVGLKEGGILTLDHKTGKSLNPSGINSLSGIYEVRTFTSLRDGGLLCGTANGLFKLSYSEIGVVELEKLDNRPVYSVFVDKDDNIWIGTYYHGVYVSNPKAFPFEHVPIPNTVNVIRGLAEDDEGKVWILTDGNGMFVFDRKMNQASLIAGTDGIKFQGAYFDKLTRSIWAGDFRGGVLQYDIKTRRMRRYLVVDDNAGAILTIIRNGEDFLIGSTTGLFLFNPVKEKAIHRKVPGIDKTVLDCQVCHDGKVLIASMGLYELSADGTIVKLDAPAFSCSQIAPGGDGGYWLAYSRKGAAYYKDGHISKIWNSANCGLADNFVQCVVPCNDGKCLVGTSSGISVLDPQRGECFNYSVSNGLIFASARGGTSIVLSDGTIWIGGNEGVESIPGGRVEVAAKEHNLVVDKIEVNGEPLDMRAPFGTLVLHHNENNISFVTATFDYISAQSVNLQYKMSGIDDGWRGFKIGERISYMGLSPGSYIFNARIQDAHSGEASVSIPITIKNVWYKTTIAIISLVFLVLLAVLVITYNIYSRKKLSTRLENEVKEKEEKTRFFVNLSYQVRTPLNLIIGQLERFFRDFGARTNGIENIQDIYNKATLIRGMISGYVDEQNKEIEAGSKDVRVVTAVRDARFLNAAIGVVERNLFSEKVNISLLSSELNVGKTALTKRIKKLTGMTPREFIEDIRLKHAAQMLKDGTYRISEISELLLFCSPGYFCEKFHKSFGVSPRDYMNQNLPPNNNPLNPPRDGGENLVGDGAEDAS